MKLTLVINRLFYRVKNAIKIGYWAFKNPDSLNPSNFKMLSDLFGLIMKVANERKHYMTRLAYIHPTEGEQEIVTIWAGAGIESDPKKRIADLISENAKLKVELSKYITSESE